MNLKYSIKNKRYLNFLSAVIILLIGNGLLWQYYNSKHQKEMIKLKKVELSFTLNDKIIETLAKINALNLQYHKEGGSINNIYYNQQFNLLRDNLLEYERELSRIKKRKPRRFVYPYPFDEFPPAPPKDLRMYKK